MGILNFSTKYARESTGIGMIMCGLFYSTVIFSVIFYGLLVEKFLASPLFVCYTTNVAKKHACGFF